MKIGEIISLTQEKPMNQIAKEHLNIGEKPARQALTNAGGISQKGKRGWLFEGPEENLEKSIYEFSEVKVTDKPNANVKTKVTKNEVTKRTKKTKKESDLEDMKKSSKEEKRKRASFDIDKELLKRLRVASILEEKNAYEMVEEAIRDYLDKIKQ